VLRFLVRVFPVQEHVLVTSTFQLVHSTISSCNSKITDSDVYYIEKNSFWRKQSSFSAATILSSLTCFMTNHCEGKMFFLLLSFLWWKQKTRKTLPIMDCGRERHTNGDMTTTFSEGHYQLGFKIPLNSLSISLMSMFSRRMTPRLTCKVCWWRRNWKKTVKADSKSRDEVCTFSLEVLLFGCWCCVICAILTPGRVMQCKCVCLCRK
jgi:hypothetical protein